MSAHQLQAIGLLGTRDGLTAAHGDHARADELLDAVRPEQVNQAVDLHGRASHFDHQRPGRDIDDARAVDVGDLHHLGALRRGLAGHLDQRQLALDAWVFAQVADLAHLDDLVELFGHLLYGAACAIDDHGEAHDAGLVGAADRQALNREGPLTEEAEDAVERRRPLFHGGYQGVLAHRSLPSFGLGPAPARARSRTASYGVSGRTSPSEVPPRTQG